MRIEKLGKDRVEPGDDGTVLEGAKVSKKVLSPLICFTVTDIVRREQERYQYVHGHQPPCILHLNKYLWGEVVWWPDAISIVLFAR